ncbi:MAG TPA: hypothetical protein VE010_20840, partial [Thermoanaerobaculia bacterium]|nr:hypothetical protein [Thermoanaerobaculia bacterium]
MPNFKTTLFPLTGDSPDASSPEMPADLQTIGLCFSGGGSRALSCALGQYRALEFLGHMGDVHYISSVSGGTWASAAYTFLPSHYTDEDFLGPATTKPGDLTLFERYLHDAAALDYLTPHNLGHVPPRLNFLSDIQVLYDLKEKYGYANDVLWQGLIGERIFNLWGLWNVDANGLPTQYYSRNERYVEKAVIDNNPSLDVSDFVLTQRNRPYLIINSSIISNPLQDGAQLLPFESSEVGIGVRATFNDGVNGQTIGGGLIQPFAMGSTWQSDLGTTMASVTQPSRPFSLVDMAGISSAAFAQTVQAQYPDFDGIVPKYNYWPVADRQNTPVYNYDFADGGSLENTGLLSLLARNVRRVIVFANAATPLTKDGDEITVSSEIALLFGKEPTLRAHANKEPHQQVPPNDDWTFNQVFAEDEYQPLLEALWEMNGVRGRAAMVKQTLTVQPNANWGIAGNYDVEILWVYNTTVANWMNALTWEVRTYLETVPNFPNYNTVLQLGLSVREVNALVQLSFWALYSERE